MERQPELAARLAGLRDELVAGVRREVPDAIYNGDPELGPEHRLPGNAHLEFPGCEGDSLLMLLDARGIECSTGSACDAGVPQASHVLLAMGSSEEFARSSLRFSLGHSSTQADVDALVEAIAPGRRARPQRRARDPEPRRKQGLMRVLAAMSGGVDSAVAAARAAEQGHDVTGIHLALSRNPKSYRTGARGCCTIEDANDARRAADVIGIPFYVWDLSERFHEDVVEDFLSEYAEGRTPNPCLRCNEKIKFAAVLDRAVALGFDAVVTGHYAQLSTDPDGLIEMHRAEDMGKDQSYVLGVLTQEQLAHSMFPLGDTPKPEIRRRGRATWAGGRRQAGQPRHLLHQRRRHRRLALREARLGRLRGQPQRVDRHRRRRGARDARGFLALHDRPAPRPAHRDPCGGRTAALRARHRAGVRHRHGGSARGPRRRRAHRDQAALVRRGPAGADGVHRPAARARRRAPGGGDGGRRRRSTYTSSTRPRASLPARRSWSTTGPGSSARPPSTPPGAPAVETTR